MGISVSTVGIQLKWKKEVLHHDDDMKEEFVSDIKTNSFKSLFQGPSLITFGIRSAPKKTKGVNERERKKKRKM